MKKNGSIDDYITGFPEETRVLLEQIRTIIKKLAPDAEEGIGYGVPAFRMNGKPMIYFAGFKKHVAIYPAPREIDEFKAELKGYKGGKGTVQFPLNKPLPLDLIKRIVKFRIRDNVERAKKRKSSE